MTWPSATSGTSTPAPPHATNARQPRAISSSRNPAASGAPTPGCITTRRRPSWSISKIGLRPISLTTWSTILPAWRSTTSAITSWKKQSTAWGAIDIGSITSPGSITAVGDGSNSRIGARSAPAPSCGPSALTRGVPGAMRAGLLRSPAPMPTIDKARTVSSRNTAPSTSATTGIR